MINQNDDGFTLTFKNGNTVSVQFGPGTYSSNRDKLILDFEAEIVPTPDSETAEVAAWNSSEQWHHFDGGENVQGWRNADEVAAFIQFVSTNDLNV